MPRTESESRTPRLSGAIRRPRATAVAAADSWDTPAGPLVGSGEVDDGAFDPQRSFLLPRFRAFYAELTRIKRVALRDPLALLGADAVRPLGEPQPTVQDVATEASQRLRVLLEQLSLDASSEGGDFGASLFEEAEYAMAALADEIFLNTDWAGREPWLDVMLERGMFGSQLAGEEIFNRIDKLLINRTAAAADLATVYFMLLSLGFQGKFRGEPAKLDAYKQRLYRFLYRKEPPGARDLMVSQAYGHTIGGKLPARLPHIQRWTIIFSVIVVLYLAISHMEWRRLTKDVRGQTDQILETTRNAAKLNR